MKPGEPPSDDLSDDSSETCEDKTDQEPDLEEHEIVVIGGNGTKNQFFPVTGSTSRSKAESLPGATTKDTVVGVQDSDKKAMEAKDALKKLGKVVGRLDWGYFWLLKLKEFVRSWRRKSCVELELKASETNTPL